MSAERTSIQSRGERFFCNDRFSVSSIDYNKDREIIGLSTMNGKRQVVYELKAKEAKGEKTEMPQKQQTKTLSTDQINSLKTELKRTGVEIEAVKERYQIEKLEEMSAELYNKVMRALARTKSIYIV